MAKKKKNPNIAKRLEYKIAAKSRRERTIMRIACAVIGALVLAVIVGIIIYNMIQNSRSDASNREYVDYATESREETDQNNRVVATINGIEVPYEALRFHTFIQKSRLESEYGEGIWDSASTAEPHRAELEAAVMRSLQADYMILSVCNKLGINTDQEAVIEYVNQQITAMWEKTESDFESGLNGAENYESAEAMYLASLSQMGMSENQLRTYLKVNLEDGFLLQLVFTAMEQFGHFTYVLSNIESFEDYVVSETDGRANFYRTLQVAVEDEATAKQIYDELTAIIDPTERLNKMYDYIGNAVNKDTNMTTKDGYYLARGEMEDAYENAVYAVGYGDVAGPVKTEEGLYCVVMRLEPDATYITTHIADLLVRYQNTIMNTYVESFREACQVEYTAYGEQLDLVNLR